MADDMKIASTLQKSLGKALRGMGVVLWSITDNPSLRMLIVHTDKGNYAFRYEWVITDFIKRYRDRLTSNNN